MFYAKRLGQSTPPEKEKSEPRGKDDATSVKLAWRIG